MGREHGKSAAKAWIIDGVRLFKKKCESCLEEVNLNLNKIKSDDILFEVKNARDDVVKICDTTQRWE